MDWRLIPASAGLREFNPCHHPAGSPVGGQFCSDDGPRGSLTFDPALEKPPVVSAEQTIRESHRDIVLDVAKRLQFPLHRIDLVSKDPREFEVGGTKYKEAGHYDPTTGRIEINLRQVPDSGVGLVQLAAHEIAHARWDVFRSALALESDAIAKKYSKDFDKVFRASGDIRPEYAAEFKRLFPAHAIIADTWGHSYTSRSLMAQMVKDDGFTEYSKSYWSPAAQEKPGGWRENYLGVRFHYGASARAMDETLAEVAAWQAGAKQQSRAVATLPAYTRSPTGPPLPGYLVNSRANRLAAVAKVREARGPSKEWRRLAAKINAFYRSHARRGRAGYLSMVPE